MIFALVIVIMILSYTGYAFLPKVNYTSVFNTTKHSNEILNCDNLDRNLTDVISLNKVTCTFLDSSNIKLTQMEMKFDAVEEKLCFPANTSIFNQSANLTISCEYLESFGGLYTSMTFWLFILLTYVGTIGFNVGNCVSDAICFDVLGKQI
jgi:hypothetical protein